MSRLPEPQDLDAVAQANRRAQGKQAVFLADPAVVRVLSIAMAMAGAPGPRLEQPAQELGCGNVTPLG